MTAEAIEPEAVVAPTPRPAGKLAGTVLSWVFLLAVHDVLPVPAVGDGPLRLPARARPCCSAGRRCSTSGHSTALTRAFDDPQFGEALWLSVRLALGAIVLTLALMVPTAIWVHLRIPKARGLVETLTVLPYVVPPIALVVGVIGAYRDTAPWFFTSRYSLIPFYAVLAMPFTYRAIDAGLRAIDLRTLVDASRSCGAGWFTTMFRVLVPNLRVVAAHVGVPHRHRRDGRVHDGRADGPDRRCRRSPQQFTQREPQGAFALGLLTLVVDHGTARPRHVPHPQTRRRGRHRRRLKGSPRSWPRRSTYQAIRKTFAGAGRHRVVRPGDGARRAGQPARAVRMRQDDGAAHRRRLRAARLGRDPRRRPQRRRHAAAPPQHGDGVPELQPVPQPRRQRQRRLRLAGAPGVQGGAAAPRRRGARTRPPLPLRQPLPAPAVRRPATARGPGPGPRVRAGRAAARRTAVGARRQGARQPPRGDPPAATATRA